jgi:hypothetical protein
MTKYAILETQPIIRKVGPQGVAMNWVCVYSPSSTGMTSAGSDRDNLRKPGEDFLYSDKAKADADAAHFRADNARQVEQTKRCRGPNKTLPSTIEVIEVSA